MRDGGCVVIARRWYRPIAPVTVADDGGPVQCIRPAKDVGPGWFLVKTRTGRAVVHQSRFGAGYDATVDRMLSAAGVQS